MLLDGLQGMRDMSLAPGAAAEDGKTAGGLLGPDLPLSCIFALHLLNTYLTPAFYQQPFPL